jgi:integrase
MQKQQDQESNTTTTTSIISSRLAKPVSSAFKVLNSRETQIHYKIRMGYFFGYLNLPGNDVEEQGQAFIARARDNPTDSSSSSSSSYVEECIIDYFDYQKQRVKSHHLAASSLKSLFSPIKLFCEMHKLDRSVSWRIITRGFPKGRAAANDRIPTIEEIRKLVEYPDHRIKPIVYTMVSSGIRLGAWDYLRWKHVTPIREESTGKLLAAKLLVYAGEPEEYISFISPQAYNALKKYMDFRASHGEEIKPDSHLIRNIWRVVDIKRKKPSSSSENNNSNSNNNNRGGRVGLATAPKGLSSVAIKRILIRAQVEQGIRHELPDGIRRHEWKGAHGFRKFFETYAEASGIKTSSVKILMAHSLGVEDSYNKPTVDMLLEQYLNAVPMLTIIDTDEASSALLLQKQVAELKEKSKEENWEAEQQKKQMQTMAQEFDKMKAEIARVYSLVERQGILRPIDTETIPIDAIPPHLLKYFMTAWTELEETKKKKEKEKEKSRKK